MNESRAAIRYAKAILSLSLDSKKADIIDADMLLIASTVEENVDLQLMLNSPIIKSEQKKSILVAIFDKKVDAISIKLINLLVENKRLALLPEVAKQYIFIYDKHKGNQVAKVTTAIPLTADLEKKVLAKIKEITGKNVTLENSVDPTIIGGFILRVGDKQFDTSILGKMNNLRREFENSTYVAKV
ncbi:MAG: ATP synthase F1 subunit delta [Flavobacteriaceae bacterium]|nr:ATP synthase F1 subunit delta [Flavobacteriaceae bacterium]